MLKYTKCLRAVAYIAIGTLTLTLGQSAYAQGCRGGGGGGYSRGGYPGGMGQPNGTTGGPNSNYSSPQQAVTSSTNASVDAPPTLLTQAAELNLTSDQVQRLEKMASSGKQHGARVLTKAQKKKLAEIVRTGRKSGLVIQGPLKGKQNTTNPETPATESNGTTVAAGGFSGR